MGSNDRNQNSPRRRSRSFPVNAELLQRLRAARGWTQVEAAEKSGLSDRLIRKGEAGGDLEIQSIDILAQLYSTFERALTPDDILARPVGPAGAKGAAEPAAATSSDVALVRRFFDELWNRHDVAVIDEMLAPDCVLHAEGRERRGRAAAHARARELFAAFGEFALDIQDITEHNGLVICRWRLRLLQTGTWNGTAPTGQRLIVHGSSWVRVENGFLTEGWDYWHEPLYGRVDPA
jgi:transcriptional regulator with XRE-family HTH domain